jgi:S-formylglutathione hydrolase FrmB
MALALASLAICGATVRSPPANARGRIVMETVHSRALQGNRIGDTPDRKVTIYLPPSYDRETARRYPVLYLLHGMTSDPREWLDGTYQGLNLGLAMDQLAAAGMAEYIVVMPLADNSYGGSFYVNSAAFGRWEDFVVTELVDFVDTRFRTLRAPRSRGLAGQSMGGFGALYLAGRHADTFGHVYAMSPACLGFVGELAPDSDQWAAPGAGARAMAAAFAPERRDPSVPPPMPFVADSDGRIRQQEPVARVWREYLPLERLRRDPGPYRRLCTIALEFGRQDEIPSVRLGSREFAQELGRAKIPNTLDEYTGGHTDRTRERFESAILPFFARALATEGKSATCEIQADSAPGRERERLAR